MLTIQQNVLLAPLTTLGLGGPAELFATCVTPDDLRDALQYAAGRSMPVHILGGGSNTIVADGGVRGLVVHMALGGIRIVDNGDHVMVEAGAGESWDKLVALTVDEGFEGIECLSGIPGQTGATPIQNVGAYGQEVRETVAGVALLDRTTLQERTIRGEDCGFGYRQSRFKGVDAGRYIIMRVTLRLRKNTPPAVRYPELTQFLEGETRLPPGRPGLEAVRNAVLALRRRKSMVLDATDPNSRSVGSFFTNPVLSQEEFASLQERWWGAGNRDRIPAFAAGGSVKVPAAWLVEHAGFLRGHRTAGAGISAHHALALVSRGGTTNDLLDLASAIEAAVFARFGIRLEREPVLLS